MTRRPIIWVGGVTGSVLAHAGFATVLLWTLHPEPVQQQPSPQSELQMQAHRLPHSKAARQQPIADPATQNETRGQGVAAGSIPHSTAPSVTPQGASIAQSMADNTVLAASQATTTTAQPVATDMNKLVESAVKSAKISPATAALSQQATQTAPPAAAKLAVTSPPINAAVTLIPAGQPIASDAPAGLALAQQPADARPMAVVEPSVPAAAQQLPSPVAASLSVPEIPHITAALAFSGDGADQADPVSLAAFQSFMMPGDIAAAGDPLRDGVAGILAAVPCSRLQVMFDPETATLNLRGHLPETGLRAPVLAALQAQMGADIQVSDQMKILPRPQCGALAGISAVGLPQSTDQITNPLLIGSDTHARVLNYAGGERMFFDLTAPDYDAYVYVDYFDAGGSVLHLSPNEVAPLTLTPAQQPLRVGAKTDQDIGLQITVGPPYGQEIAVAFAASHPLYRGQRPISEEAAPYLSWLSDRVSNARAAHPDFKGEWVYFFVATAAQ